MHVGEALLGEALQAQKRSIVVVGTGKNVGKTVTVTALLDALARSEATYGVCSIGRDGEGVDALEGTAKPRVFLRPGALVATPVALLPAHPALEILELSGEESALGPVAVARMRGPGNVEIAGPPSAAALRRIIAHLHAAGAQTVVVDGAVDRIAALREDDAVIVATGAASGPTIARVVEAAALLVACLLLPAADPERPALEIEGALTAARAAELLRMGERRQVVVHDPTRVTFNGRAFAALRGGLDVRAAVQLHPLACTVASSGGGRTLEPAALLRAMALAVDLPCYDVYAGARA